MNYPFKSSFELQRNTTSLNCSSFHLFAFRIRMSCLSQAFTGNFHSRGSASCLTQKKWPIGNKTAGMLMVVHCHEHHCDSNRHSTR